MFDEVVFLHLLPRLNLVLKILTAEITNGNGGENGLVFGMTCRKISVFGF